MHTPAYRFEDLTLFPWHVLSLGSHVSMRTDSMDTVVDFLPDMIPVTPRQKCSFVTQRCEDAWRFFAGNRHNVSQSQTIDII